MMLSRAKQKKIHQSQVRLSGYYRKMRRSISLIQSLNYHFHFVFVSHTFAVAFSRFSTQHKKAIHKQRNETLKLAETVPQFDLT